MTVSDPKPTVNHWPEKAHWHLSSLAHFPARNRLTGVRLSQNGTSATPPLGALASPTSKSESETDRTDIARRERAGYTAFAFGRFTGGALRTEKRDTPPARQLLRKVLVMPKPYRVYSTRQLPADADIVQHEGKPHVRMKDRGRTVLYPLSRDGLKYLKPSKVWYFDIPDQNGKPKRTKGFTDLKATETRATNWRAAPNACGAGSPIPPRNTSSARWPNT